MCMPLYFIVSFFYLLSFYGFEVPNDVTTNDDDDEDDDDDLEHTI